MDKKILKGLIDEKLEVIQEQFSIIRAYDGKIPIIEIDLLMASIRDIYELALSLQAENMGGVMPKPTPFKEEPKIFPPAEEVPAAPEPIPEELPAVKPVTERARMSSGIISMERVIEEKPESAPSAQPFISPVIESIAPEPENVFEEEPNPEPEPQTEPQTGYEPVPEPEYENPPEPKYEQEPDQYPFQEKPQRITFDLFTENSGNTLADRLKEGQEKRIADKFQENKITDLRSTIGINDKFLFINELFEGNMRIYDEAIIKLNSSLTIAQTDLLLLDLKIVYNWDSDSPTVKKFVELIRRKF